MKSLTRRKITWKRDTEKHTGGKERRGNRKQTKKADPSLLNAAIGM